MERRHQREIALATVAVLAVGLAAYGLRTPSAGSADSRQPVRQGASGSAGVKPSVQNPNVDLEALRAPRPTLQETDRNPFRFKEAPPPPRPPSPSRAAAPEQIGPVQPPPPPRIPLKFIGITDGAKPGRVAVLRDDRGVYYGHVGDIIEGRYRIVQIGVESVELAYLDGGSRQTIRLTGQ